MATEAQAATTAPLSNIDFAARWLVRWHRVGGRVVVHPAGNRAIGYPMRADDDEHRATLLALMGEFDAAPRSAREAVFTLATKREG